MIAGVVVVVAVVPVVFYRYTYTHSKRLREVVPGRVYRSGQMTAPGFAVAVAKYGIRTIVNLQDEYPDPNIGEGYFTTQTIKERELCRQLGVRYVHLAPDLVSKKVQGPRPQVIDQFLTLMDNPDTYPVLLHCKAGLHRTGLLVAVYRMEYQGWDRRAAVREMKAHGFGERGCTVANDYIDQYILNFRPGLRLSAVGEPRAESPEPAKPPAPNSPLSALGPPLR
jgi:protein tyrosine phosphatase (PTP) superfamily phosphohydrolase (DUF442 family)